LNIYDKRKETVCKKAEIQLCVEVNKGLSSYEKIIPMAIGYGIKILETHLMNCKVKYILRIE
jgi:hypothetical protein